jgi:DHA2 family multidrug resistance protein-like MFS transporter
MTTTLPHPDGLPARTRWIAMLAMAISIAISILVGSIANVALPTIARDFGVTPAESIWVVNAYQLAVTISLMPLASLGDTYGHRRVYCWGLALYTAASFACAVAPSLSTLIVARVLQGLGGAGIMSVNGALIRFIWPRALLGRGIGYNSLVVASSSAAGPSIAAAIMVVASWPWLFLVQVPFGLFALVLALRFMPKSPVTGHAFDPLSALLNAFTLGLVITGLDGIGRGHDRMLVLAELAVGFIIGFIFVRRQFSLKAPMLPVDLFRRPVFALSVATATCAHGAQMIIMLSLPFYFQYVEGMTPIEIGFLITPWPAVLVVVAPIAGRLSDKYPAGLLGGIGLAVMALGLVTVFMMPAHASRLDIAWRLMLSAAGFGFFPSPNNRLIIASAPPDRVGVGSGMISTARLTGQTTSSALVAVVFGLTQGGVDSIALGTHVAIGMAAAFACVAMVLSWARVMGR